MKTFIAIILAMFFAFGSIAALDSTIEIVNIIWFQVVVIAIIATLVSVFNFTKE